MSIGIGNIPATYVHHNREVSLTLMVSPWSRVLSVCTKSTSASVVVRTNSKTPSPFKSYWTNEKDKNLNIKNPLYPSVYRMILYTYSVSSVLIKGISSFRR